MSIIVDDLSLNKIFGQFIVFAIFRVYRWRGCRRHIEIKIKYLNVINKRKYVTARYTVWDLHYYPVCAFKNNTRCRRYIKVFLLRVYSLFIYDFPCNFRFRSPLSNLARNVKMGRQFYEEHQSVSRVIGLTISGCSTRFILRPSYRTRGVFFFKHQMIYTH